MSSAVSSPAVRVHLLREQQAEGGAGRADGARRGLVRRAFAAAALVGAGALIGAWVSAPAAHGSSLLGKRSASGATAAHDKDCGSPDFTQQTLKLVHEAPVMRLLHLSASRELATGDVLKTFEASDVIGREMKLKPGATEHAAGMPQHEYYVVFDNARSIARFSSLLQYDQAHATNALIDYPEDDGGKSEFEAIAYDGARDKFFVLQESAEHEDGSLRGVVRELSLPSTHEHDVKTATLSHAPCATEQVFSSANKGFEGAAWLPVPGAPNEDGGYLLGLCEGNHCAGGKEGRDAGNGRIIVMEKQHVAIAPSAPDRRRRSLTDALPAANASDGCIWASVATIDVPRTAAFVDFSAIALRPLDETEGSTEVGVAIASQESAAVWLGKLKLGSGGLPSDFRLSEGRVYDFPRDGECRKVYCNIEGLAWQGYDKLVAASDQIKSKGRQDFRCWDKDQSVHTFLVPTDNMFGD